HCPEFASMPGGHSTIETRVVMVPRKMQPVHGCRDDLDLGVSRVTNVCYAVEQSVWQ
ncbi:hypothetical protein NDU88_003700, partial [Pleurodeles waltl]